MNELVLQKARGKSLAQHFTKSAAHHDKMADHHEKCMKAHEGAAEHHEAMLGKEDMEMAAGGSAFKQHHTAKNNFHKTMASTHEKMHKAHAAHAEHHRAMAKVSELSGEDAKNKPSESVKAAFAQLGIEIEDIPETIPETTPNPEVKTAATTGDSDMSKNETQPVTTTATTTTTTSTDPNAALAAATTAAAVAAFSGGAGNSDEYQAALYKQFNEGMQAALKQGLAEALANPEFKKTIQEQIGNMLLGELNKKALTPTPVKTFAVPRTQTTSESIASGVTPRLSGVENLDPALADLISMGN